MVRRRKSRRSSVVERTLCLFVQRRDVGKARIAPLAGKCATDQVVDTGDGLAGAPMGNADGKALGPVMECCELRPRRIGDYDFCLGRGVVGGLAGGDPSW